jgi:hypothetical protein
MACCGWKGGRGPSTPEPGPAEACARPGLAQSRDYIPRPTVQRCCWGAAVDQHLRRVRPLRRRRWGSRSPGPSSWSASGFRRIRPSCRWSHQTRQLIRRQMRQRSHQQQLRTRRQRRCPAAPRTPARRPSWPPGSRRPLREAGMTWRCGSCGVGIWI